jgi:hypothetical protein
LRPAVTMLVIAAHVLGDNLIAPDDGSVITMAGLATAEDVLSDGSIATAHDSVTAVTESLASSSRSMYNYLGPGRATPSGLWTFARPPKRRDSDAAIT